MGDMTILVNRSAQIETLQTIHWYPPLSKEPLLNSCEKLAYWLSTQDLETLPKQDPCEQCKHRRPNSMSHKWTKESVLHKLSRAHNEGIDTKVHVLKDTRHSLHHNDLLKYKLMLPKGQDSRKQLSSTERRGEPLPAQSIFARFPRCE